MAECQHFNYGALPVCFARMSTRKTTKPKDAEAEAKGGDKYILRFPKGSRMRPRLRVIAKQEFRSMNSEVLARLQKSLDRPTALRTWAPEMLVDEIEQRAEAAGVDFQDMLNSVLAAGLREGAPQVLYISVAPGATAQDIRAALDATRDAVASNAPIFIGYTLSPTSPKK